MKNKFLIIVCSLFMMSTIAKADWVAGNTTVRPGSPITACVEMEAEGTFSWFSVLPYANDISVATFKILLPNVVLASTGTPTMVDLATNTPYPNVTFNLSTTPGGSAWEATFGTGTIVAPFTVLVFKVSNLKVMDTTKNGLLMSNTIEFLSSPANDAAGNNGSSVNFSIAANPTGLAPITSNDSLIQADGTTISYYDSGCFLIATVNDNAGGNTLGATVSTVNLGATAGVHNGQPFVRRWYQITPTNNGPATVTIYANQSDFDNYNSVVAAPYDSLPSTGSNTDPKIANIHVTKNDDGGLSVNPIVLIPTSVNWNGTYWEITVATPAFSQFRIHSANPANTPLSVQYKEFTVAKQATADLVEWTTFNEKNNSRFNVQRSADGITFETLGPVNSKAVNGLSVSELNYNFLDENPQIGHNYYRLEQVDMDNSKNYTKTIDIIWGAEGSVVSIYPNPTKDFVNIDLSTDKVSQVEIKLLDMSGRVVKSVLARTAKGMNYIKLELAELATGVYGVQIYENNKLSHASTVRKN